MSPGGPETSTPLLRARSLAFRYPSGRTGLASVDLRVAPGERVVLMGPNGSGKTTFLRLAWGDLRPDGGTLEVLGAPAGRFAPALRRRMAVVEADPVHVEALTGAENALAFARAAGVPAAVARARIRTLLDALDLGGDADVPAAEYSSGMRRKLLLVEAFARDADLFLMDEPTLALDPPSVATVSRTLAERCAAGAAALVATNDPAVAPSLADRVVFLDGGRIVADGTPANLLAPLRERTWMRVRLGSPPRAPLVPPPGVRADEVDDGLLARAPDGTARLPSLLQAVLATGATVRSVEVREPHLGDVFLHLTGRALGRDAQAPDGAVATNPAAAPLERAP